ncbi:hypothetical protein SAMN05446037_1002160 [Anaerovirgula multivorans]|uniref:Uncharacterized protein n=1 Tax=Anaerovirgula multivorans TaxID=312168 RepID=A0A239APD5_9FIRM|nr:hypothetical protein [Anaerovirgula multivorans]SNR97152.1 hypothetical protein SAMN05446037_1002160 [Anaerovirgula multivorans]
MKLIKGKKILKEEVLNYLQEKTSLQEIFFYGIVDKEIIDIVSQKAFQMENTISFKIIIPNLHDFKFVNWLRNHQRLHNNYQVRTNPKCSGQYIVVDDMMIFISGTDASKYTQLNQEVLFVIEQHHNGNSLFLKGMFLNEWANGYDLHL